MNSISIVVPFKNAAQKYLLWSMDERKIDFRRDKATAARCSSAFAAAELQHYLTKSLKDTKVVIVSEPPVTGFFIELNIVNNDDFRGGFVIEPCSNGLRLIGSGRAGLIYAAYELLRFQGWRWFAPGKSGELAPEKLTELILPNSRLEIMPSMNYRGFDFEKVSLESNELLLWMARNRMNVYGWRFASGALGRKLGMTACGGGHIFEAILNPDNVLPNGKTIWDGQREWYGIPADGERCRERALRTQFCVSADGLIEYLADKLLEKLTTEWQELDIVYVWGFDTWGGVCHCPACQAIGNATDVSIYFLSALRQQLTTAQTQGRLDHQVKLAICAYEGTSNLQPPSKPFPENIIQAGDIAIFYPINRCFNHDLFDESCTVNHHYSQALAGWLKFAPHIELWVGEYYNVSKYEDLPLLFSTRISQDIPHYNKIGVRGMTYMHLPLVNWAMRTQTQLLYAQMQWDAQTDFKSWINEYFSRWYGIYSEEMATVYQLLETAWNDISQWRNWHRSILDQLLIWDGMKPRTPLQTNYHYNSITEFITCGHKSVKLLNQAQAIINKILKTARENHCTTQKQQLVAAVNPEELLNQRSGNEYIARIAEDRRLLRYGIDTMSLMTDLTDYHHELFINGERTASLLSSIVEQAEIMDIYYIPIGYEQPGAGLRSLDALTRSQLREVVERL